MVKTLICASGGIDSSALIVYYLEQGFDVHTLHFDYGHPAYEKEKEALDAVCRYFQVPVKHEKLATILSKTNVKSGELIGRNALFLLGALGYLSDMSGLISLGIHSGPPSFYDCSRDFVKHMQLILDGYLGGTVVFDTPFLEFHKSEIITWAREKELPLNLTYSCQSGGNPCGQCPSCLERKSYGL